MVGSVGQGPGGGIDLGSGWGFPRVEFGERRLERVQLGRSSEKVSPRCLGIGWRET